MVSGMGRGVNVRRRGRCCRRHRSVRVAVGKVMGVAVCIAVAIGRRSVCIGCVVAMRIRLRGGGCAGSRTILHAGAASRRCRCCRRILSSMGIRGLVSVVGVMRRIGGRGHAMRGAVRIDLWRFRILRSRLGVPGLGLGLALCLLDRLGLGGRCIVCGSLGLACVGAMRVGFRRLCFRRSGLCSSRLRRRSMATAMIVMRGIGGQCEAAAERER